MSNNKQINTRIQHKHDIESNWIKATNFIPKAGEIIVYDPDDNYDYARIKIGDGLTPVNELKFSEIQPDWNVNDENDPAYIKNRPFYTTDAQFVTIFESSALETGKDNYADISFAYPINEGQTYFVTLNGEEYECIASIIELKGPVFCIGNPEIHPFLIDVEDADVNFETEGPHSFSISTYQSEVIKIPSQFLNLNIANGEGIGSIKEGLGTTASGDYSHAEGEYTIASGRSSHAEGSETIASDSYSHAEGNNTIASGWISHAEGTSTEASGYYSHAEGSYTTASGNQSHAEGLDTKASGDTSHTEGNNTEASGQNSHAEGESTTASGYNSHAEGCGTEASGNYQHVQGKYNISDTTFAHIVGNGDWDELSNAHTLDWDGNAWFAGDVYVGSTSGINKDEGSKKLLSVREADSLPEDVNSGDLCYLPSLKGYIIFNCSYDSSSTCYIVSELPEIGAPAAAFPGIVNIYYNTNEDVCYCYIDSSLHSLTSLRGWVPMDDEEVTSLLSRFLNVAWGGIISNVEAADRDMLHVLLEPSSDLYIYKTNKWVYISDLVSKDEISDLVSEDEMNTAISSIPTPDVSGQINAHNINTSAHADIRAEITSATTALKNELLNGAGEAYDTLKELGDLIDDNTDALDALEAVAANKSNATNLVNGLASDGNSIRQIGATAEDSTYTLGNNASAFGDDTKASGYASHAEGSETIAAGNYSHAEGNSTEASGFASHTEGMGTIASGVHSHAEGRLTIASGHYGSHAEGSETKASGESSHAEGWKTTANSKSQHVQGEYNILDVEDTNNRGTYAHIVGNGAPSARSNAHTLDWDGNAWFAGNVYVGSTSGTNKDEGSKKLVTVDEMNAAIAAAIEAAFANIARAEEVSF